jgi:hypothetical protein
MGMELADYGPKPPTSALLGIRPDQIRRTP